MVHTSASVSAKTPDGSAFNLNAPGVWQGSPCAPVSEADILRVTSDIDNNGYAVIENFLSAETLESMQDFITKSVDDGGGQYLGLIGPEAVAGTALGELGNSPSFNRLMRRVYEFGAKGNVPTQGLYQVVRCLKGASSKVHSYYFHYDSYVVTALVPVHIPSQGRTGDLVMSVNRRPIRSSYILNAIDKVLLNNKLAQFVMKRLAKAGLFGFKTVKMVPGNVYFFWGCRTIHANEPCDLENIRATAIFHFGDPYTESGLRKFTGKAKYRAKIDAPVAAPT